MAHLFKFDVGFTFFILIVGFHLGSVQFKDVAHGSRANDYSSKIQADRAKKNEFPLIMIPIRKSHQLMGNEHLWSSLSDSQTQTPSINPLESHQSRHYPSHSLSCSPQEFACADGLQCVPERWICDDYEDCNDGSDESESLCTPPCLPEMFACADGSQCIPQLNVCDGNPNGGCLDKSNNLPSQCTMCSL